VTYAEPRSAHSSSQVPLYNIGADGKPTRISNRNASTANSFAAEWFGQLAPFNREASLIPFPPQRGCFARLNDYPAWIKSTLPTLPNGTVRTVTVRPALNPFSLHELASGVRRKLLTKVNSTGYAGMQKGEPRCDHLVAKSSGSVPGALDNQGKEARS